MGGKRAANQTGPSGRERGGKEYVWGYGTGVVAATDPWYGDVVLAEQTRPFNEHDVTYFHPLFRPAVASLGRPPTIVAAEATFDAWHVDQPAAQGGGSAAIPLNLRGQAPRIATPTADRAAARA